MNIMASTRTIPHTGLMDELPVRLSLITLPGDYPLGAIPQGKLY